MGKKEVTPIRDLILEGRIAGVPIVQNNSIVIEGVALKQALAEMGIKVGDPLRRLVPDTEISCEALYVMNDGPLLMVFQADIEDHLIGELTGEPTLGRLFFVEGCMVRLLRVPNKTALEALKRYCAGLGA